jgi:hypothetical protein
VKKKIAAWWGRLSKREKTIVFVTGIIIVFFVLDRIVVGPATHKMTALDTQIRDKEAAIKQSLHVLVQKDKIMSEGRRYESYSVDSPNPEKETVALLKDIESTADRAGVSLLYVKPAKDQRIGSVHVFYATLECESEMTSLAGFFHEIEGSNKLLKIEKFDIQPKSRDSSIARCAMTVSKTVLIK